MEIKNDSCEENYDDEGFLSNSTCQPIEISSDSHSMAKFQVAKRPRRLKQKSYRKKVETTWSHENILKLIHEVKRRRSLWDTECAEYKLNKDSVWQEVADAIPVSFNDCKGKWANLRTTFNSNLGKDRKNNSGKQTDEFIPIAWKYFKPMMFLKTTKARQTSQSTTSMQLKSAAKNEPIEKNLELTLRSPSPKSVTKHNIDLQDMPVDAMPSMRCVGSQPRDTNTIFGEYIASELRNLTSEQASLVRAKLRRTLNDVLEKIALTHLLQEPEQK